MMLYVMLCYIMLYYIIQRGPPAVSGSGKEWAGDRHAWRARLIRPPAEQRATVRASRPLWGVRRGGNGCRGRRGGCLPESRAGGMARRFVLAPPKLVGFVTVHEVAVVGFVTARCLGLRRRLVLAPPNILGGSDLFTALPSADPPPFHLSN